MFTPNGGNMFCVPESSILNVWDILKPHNSLVLACISDFFLQKTVRLLKGFTT